MLQRMLHPERPTGRTLLHRNNVLVAMRLLNLFDKQHSVRAQWESRNGLEMMNAKLITSKKANAIPIILFQETFLLISPMISVRPIARKKKTPIILMAVAMPAVTAARMKYHPKCRLSRLRKYKVRTAKKKVNASGCHHRLFWITAGTQSRIKNKTNDR
jgi:hypothetical protein